VSLCLEIGRKGKIIRLQFKPLTYILLTVLLLQNWLQIPYIKGLVAFLELLTSKLFPSALKTFYSKPAQAP